MSRSQADRVMNTELNERMHRTEAGEIYGMIKQRGECIFLISPFGSFLTCC